MAKPTTTQEFLSKFIEKDEFFGKLLILDATKKQAQLIVNNQEECIKQMKECFIDGQSYIDTAKRFIKELDEFEKR